MWLTRGDCCKAVYGTTSIVLGRDGLSVRARQLIGSTGFVGSVVVTMARFVVTIGEDGQVAFGLVRGEARLALAQRLLGYGRCFFDGVLLGRHVDRLLVVLGVFRGRVLEARADASSAVGTATTVFIG
jgi:hypothetical protein